MSHNLENNEWVVVKSKRNNNKNNILYNNYSYKKILCKNINNCSYDYKCRFAHNIDEQIIVPIRKTAYNMIKQNIDLSHINLQNDNFLYANLLCLTNLCIECCNQTCTGGYNCKHGACSANLVICCLDLNSGECNGECDKIHLTQKGLNPYKKHINNYRNNIPYPIILNDTCFETNNDIFSDTDSECDNILLTRVDTNNTENILIKSIFNINFESI